MPAFDDTTKDIDGRASERMSFRVKPHVEQIIQRAAALSGVDSSVFTMSAAYQSALATIAAHEHTVLEPADHAAFFEALDTPPQPSAKLKEAFARHKSRVISKCLA